MKSIWSVPSVLCFVLCALCSPPGIGKAEVRSQKSGVRMKSVWSLLFGPGFVLCALCSPPGFSCPSKSHSSQASNVSRGPEPRKWRARNVWARAGPKGSTPSGSRNLDDMQSVGGGRKTPRPCPRLLIFNPFGVQTKNAG